MVARDLLLHHGICHCIRRPIGYVKYSISTDWSLGLLVYDQFECRLTTRWCQVAVGKKSLELERAMFTHDGFSLWLDLGEARYY